MASSGVRVFNEATCGLLDVGTPGDCDVHDSLFPTSPSIDYGIVHSFNNMPCDYASGFQLKDKCIGGKAAFSCVQPTQCIVDYTHGVPAPMRIIKLCGKKING